jgi:hypothetical protein
MVFVRSAVVTGSSSDVSETWSDEDGRKGVRCGVRIACCEGRGASVGWAGLVPV